MANDLWQLRALSIMQPWSWLIVNGHKDIENRDWPTRVRGPVLIHAGKKFDGNKREDLGTDWMGVRLPNDLDMGGIVGVAEIVDCLSESDSPWFFGRFGFLLRAARPLPFRPCRGALGFFRPAYEGPAP